MTFGIEIQKFMFPWLAFHMTDSKLLVGLTAFCLGVPNIALMPFGGVLADRAGRTTVVRVTQSALAVLSFLLAGLLLANGLSVWGLMVFAVLLAVVLAFDQPARQSVLPSLTPRALLTNAMAMSSTAWSTARICGPAAAGGLLVLLMANGLEPGGVFAVAASAYAVMALCMFRVHMPPMAPRADKRSVMGDMVDGFSYVARTPALRTIFLLLLASSTFGLSYVVMLPVLAKEVYGVDAQGLGLIVAGSGVGGLVGGVLLAIFGGSKRRGLLTLLGGGTFGALLTAFGLSGSVMLSAGLLFLIGVVSAFYQTGTQTLLQVIVPDEMRGRVMANYAMVWSLSTVGGTIAGIMAEFWGVQAAVAIGGVVILATTAACWLATPALRTLD
jgi:MFS family permease